MTITKTKLFIINLISCIAAVFMAFRLFDHKALEMYFWIPILVYFMIQFYLFYLSKKTKIKKIHRAGLINLVIASLLSLFFTFLVVYFIVMRIAMGAMKD